MEPGFMLADSLATAWLLGDAPLRGDLQALIRTYSHRNTFFAQALRAALAARQQVFRPSETFRPAHELASSLSAAWLFADIPLRLDLQHAIHGYAQRHPEIVPILKRIADTRAPDLTEKIVWRIP